MDVYVYVYVYVYVFTGLARSRRVRRPSGGALVGWWWWPWPCAASRERARLRLPGRVVHGRAPFERNNCYGCRRGRCGCHCHRDILYCRVYLDSIDQTGL
jgi:hypothetical protein